MKKKIIVPTDFSENALLAAKYACQLAIDKGYHVQLVHCYNSDTSIFDEKLNNNEEITPLLKGDFIMTEWKDSLQLEYPEISLDGECTKGLVSEIIPKIAIAPNYSLLIMGSNGLEENDSPLFGSTTSQVASSSRIPVIAVPYYTNITPLKKAAILTNFKDDELDSLKDYVDLLGMPHELDIIHVYQNSDDINEVTIKIKNWATKIQEITPNITVNTILKPINYSSESQDTIAEVVNNTIEDNKYNIVIVTKTRKSFFDKLFSKSISKEVILKLETAIFFDNN